MVKGGYTLEVFSHIKNFVFDKTGTLTTGKFSIREINYEQGEPSLLNTQMLELEKHSSHPIARSLVRELENADHYPATDGSSELINISESKGEGVSATDEAGNTYRLGTRRFAAPFLSEGSFPIYFSKNDQLLATVQIEDEIKPEAREVIGYLHRSGKNPVILSGDIESKTRSVAEKLNVDTFYAEQLPASKLAVIDTLNRESPTAMIGDGINDAPALAKATLGISLSNASQVAMQSAQIILLNGNLDRLPTALAISNATLQTIRQNLFWAFAYNIIAIPVAAAGFLNPMWGALFMAFSDVVVIGNSIRLKFRKIEQAG